jgi:hypothetical protein
VVETSRLESGHTLTGIGGSNPSLSAMFLHIPSASGNPYQLRSCLSSAVPSSFFVAGTTFDLFRANTIACSRCETASLLAIL